MGRRSLRKIDPKIDLSRHLTVLDDLPPACTAESLFGASGPLEVEVGTGKGLFLASAAAARPEAFFLGIELATKYAGYAAARLARAGLTNARVVHGDALRVFRERMSDDSLAAVHVYFPDPWWKARHKKRRVMNAGLLADVQRTLVPGGSLHFWTDVEEYYCTTLEIVAQATRLVGPLPVAEQPATSDLDYRTHFERRTRIGGGAVYRAEFTKPV